jgi:hypothetical protein
MNIDAAGYFPLLRLESYGLQVRGLDVVGLLGLENLEWQGELLVLLLDDLTGKMG